jgi:16S rRNA processing protein RimM
LKTLELGRITRPHGVQGELKLKLHFEEGASLVQTSHLVLTTTTGETAEYALEKVRRSGKLVIVCLEGVSSRDAAEALRGATVSVDRARLQPLADDEYYLADLVGCRVEAPSGPVGVVEAVRSHPTLDSLMIRTAAGVLLEQPIHDAWVERVSVQEQLIRLSTEDGLID